MRVIKMDKTVNGLEKILKSDDFENIYQEADRIRRENKGDIIHIRAILEFSNYCKRQCLYCGLNCKNSNITRFRIPPEEMVQTAKEAARVGYRTIVLQSGEDRWYTSSVLGEIVKEIKKTGMKITLSCGELSFNEYTFLKSCGADRYLLKHETSDETLYEELHPCGTFYNRINCLKQLKTLGYRIGSGFMIGLPGQTFKTIAKDILLLKELSCDMAGIGPFLPHQDTLLRKIPPGSAELTKRAVALTRILLPNIDLPATTSLGVLNQEQKASIFSCGANVVMKKVTPDHYKHLYEIYPSKMGKTDVKVERQLLEKEIRALGKIPL